MAKSEIYRQPIYSSRSREQQPAIGEKNQPHLRDREGGLADAESKGSGLRERVEAPAIAMPRPLALRERGPWLANAKVKCDLQL